ncbi:MAG: membrane protein insertase YidC, partial [Alphaproteobacteria bacterium]
MTHPNSKDQMHPEDLRNLLIFAIISVLIWFAYDSFILKPQAEALRQARIAKMEALKEQDPDLYNELVNQSKSKTPDVPEIIDRDEAIAKFSRISIANEELSGSIRLRGGRIDDVSLNKHFKTKEQEEKVSILSPVSTQNPRFLDFGWVSENKNINLPNVSSQWRVEGNTKLTPQTPVTLVWDNGQDIRFERTITLDDQYMFQMTQRVINNSGEDLFLHPYGLASQTGIPVEPGSRSTWVSYEGPLGFIGGVLEKVSYGSLADTPTHKVTAQRGWISFSDKYWLTALVPQQDNKTTYRFKLTPAQNKQFNQYQADFTASEMHIPNGAVGEYSQRFYVGVKEILTLEDYEENLNIDQFDLAVDFGWFWFFTYPFFLLLHNLGNLFGNMGFAIIVQTIILRMAVFPLTNLSYRSFAKMKVVGPQIQELREAYGDDKAKLQEEIVALYQREGVNPMSGCLPILVQIPIFFAFYKILFTTVEIRHAPFIGWIQDLSAPDPTNVFTLFGLLDYDVSFLPQIGVWPCLMLAAMLIQKRLNPPPQDNTQRIMMRFFPFMITYIMSQFASGLVIYWTFSAT